MSSKGEKWRCYRFGIKIGIFSMLKGNSLIGIKQFLFPISYWRFPIYNITLENIEQKVPKRILDIGSPKLLSLYLALEAGHTVFATDLQDTEIFTRFRQHFSDYGSIETDRYVVEYQDGRALKYPNEYFDVVYSISVFEHMPDTGDMEAAREVGRVLKRNGKAIIEVPFSESLKNEYMHKNVYDRKYLGEPVFYQRHYDESSVFSRIINESGLFLENAIVTSERMSFEKYWSHVPKFVRIPLLWLEPLFSRVNHYSCKLQNWKELKKHKQSCSKGMNITLVLRKI